jgi:hypothetical protein
MPEADPLALYPKVTHPPYDTKLVLKVLMTGDMILLGCWLANQWIIWSLAFLAFLHLKRCPQYSSPQAAHETMGAEGSHDFGISSKKEGHPSSDIIMTSEPREHIAPPEGHGEEVTQLPKPPETDEETKEYEKVSNEIGESASGVLSSNGEGKELGGPSVDRESLSDDGSSTLNDNPEANGFTILTDPSTPSEGNHERSTEDLANAEGAGGIGADSEKQESGSTRGVATILVEPSDGNQERSKEQSEDLANAGAAGGASVDSEKQEGGSSVIAMNGSTILMEPSTPSAGNQEGSKEQSEDLVNAEGVSEDPEKDGHRSIGGVVTGEMEPSASLTEGNNEESREKTPHLGSSATDKESANGDEEASKEEGRIHGSVALEKSEADAANPTSPSDEHSEKSEEHSQNPPAVAPSTGTIANQNQDTHEGGCCGGCIIC